MEVDKEFFVKSEDFNLKIVALVKNILE